MQKQWLAHLSGCRALQPEGKPSVHLTPHSLWKPPHRLPTKAIADSFLPEKANPDTQDSLPLRASQERWVDLDILEGTGIRGWTQPLTEDGDGLDPLYRGRKAPAERVLQTVERTPSAFHQEIKSLSYSCHHISISLLTSRHQNGDFAMGGRCPITVLIFALMAQPGLAEKMNFNRIAAFMVAEPMG